MFAPTFVQACRRRSGGPYPIPAGFAGHFPQHSWGRTTFGAGMGVGAGCRAEWEFMSPAAPYECAR
jgi:hypothetical protein